MPISLNADGDTSLSVYEHVNRSHKLDGFALGGWSEITGGGIVREGQTLVFGGGGKIRGLTNGKAVPQQITAKYEGATWEGIIVPALRLKALALGIFGEDAYMKVNTTFVDHWAAQELGRPSITITTVCRISSEKQLTTNDGKNSEYEVVWQPAGLPTKRMGI